MRIKTVTTLLLIFIISILSVGVSSALLNAQEKMSEKEKYGGTLTVAIPMDTKSLDSVVERKGQRLGASCRTPTGAPGYRRNAFHRHG